MRKFLFVSLVLLMGAAGCGKTYESSIPSVSFSFSCNLNQSPYYKMTTPGQFLKVTRNVNGLLVGYGGLIIGRSVFSDAGNPLYCAYDAACPVEASRSVSLEVEDDGLGTARCPECGAVFNLSANGTRSDGLGGEILRSYKVTLAGDNLRVQN